MHDKLEGAEVTGFGRTRFYPSSAVYPKYIGNQKILLFFTLSYYVGAYAKYEDNIWPGAPGNDARGMRDTRKSDVVGIFSDTCNTNILGSDSQKQCAGYSQNCLKIAAILLGIISLYNSHVSGVF